MTTEKLSDYICQTCGKLIKAVTGHTRKECIDYRNDPTKPDLSLSRTILSEKNSLQIRTPLYTDGECVKSLSERMKTAISNHPLLYNFSLEVEALEAELTDKQDELDFIHRAYGREKNEKLTKDALWLKIASLESELAEYKKYERFCINVNAVCPYPKKTEALEIEVKRLQEQCLKTTERADKQCVECCRTNPLERLRVQRLKTAIAKSRLSKAQALVEKWRKPPNMPYTRQEWNMRTGCADELEEALDDGGEAEKK